MSSLVGHALGVDFGTSHTVAVIRWPDGRARPLLIDGSPLLPSAVYAESDGTLIAGRDAVHSARLDPACFEPNPKRRIDDGIVLLGDHEVPVTQLITAVLSRVAEECRRALGAVTPTVTLTCPSTWGATRRTVLSEAATQAGLPNARLVAEPVAATTYFAKVLGRDVPIGSVVVVHDFGAGTFDASVVVRRASGFEVLAVDGCDDVGGIDIDAALVEYLRSGYESRDPAAWARLTDPATVEDRRAKRQLWDDVRVAKERLSRAQRADLVLPLIDVAVHVTRNELEELAKPLLDRTVRVTENLMRWARLAEGSVAGVFLVGGSSRIPLLATLLHRTLGEAPVVIEQPELVVAEGSVLADAALLSSTPAAPGPTALLRLPSIARSGNAPTPDGSPATPVSPAPVGPDAAFPVGLPVSPAPTAVDPSASDAALTSVIAPAAGGGLDATVPVSSLAPGSLAPPVSPGPSGTPVPSAGSGPGASVGRVIVPGAQPPGRARTGPTPVNPTRQMPRVAPGPSKTMPLPPKSVSPPPPRRGPAVVPASPAPRRQQPPQPAARPQRSVEPRRPVDPRRPSALLGFVRGLFITAFLITVPLAVGFAAYTLARYGR